MLSHRHRFMRREIMAFLSILCLSFSVGAAPFSAFANSKAPIPMLVEFVSRGAGHTRSIENELYSDPAVLDQLSRSFGTVRQRKSGPWTESLRREANSRKPVMRANMPGVIRIAVEDFPEMAEKWNVTSVPTFFVVGSNGAMIARHEGIPTAAKFIAFIRNNVPAPQKWMDESTETTTTPAQGYLPSPASQIPVSSMVTVPWTSGGAAEPEPKAPTLTSPLVLGGYSREPLRAPTATQPSRSTDRETSLAKVAAMLGAGAGDDVIVEWDTVTRGEFRKEGAKELFREREFKGQVLWTVDLKSTPDNVDIDLEIQDENGNQLAHAESPSGEEHLILAAGAGKYKVRAFAFRDAEIRADFEVIETVKALPAGRIVPKLSGKALALDENRELILRGDAPSWLAFSASSPGRFKFTFDEQTPENVSFNARAYNSAGEMIGELKDGMLIVETLVAGRIAVKITPYGAQEGTVSVRVAKHSEINAEAVQLVIAPDDNKAGSVGGSAGLEKVYRIRAPRAGTWELAITSAKAGVDIDLEILKEDGTLVERSEGPTAEESIRVETNGGEDKGGTDREDRFARVYVYRAIEPAPFSLSMKEVAASSTPSRTPSPSRFTIPANTPTLAISTPRRERVGRNETDWIKFTPERTGLYTILLDGGTTQNDVDLAAHASDGQQIGISQNDLAREAIFIRLEAGTPVFIRVFAFQDSPGSDYKLWIQPLEQ